MEKVTIYASILNGGDGSAYIDWFITADAAEKSQEDQNEYEGWAEECIETVETFVGSKTHDQAIKNEKYYRKEWLEADLKKAQDPEDDKIEIDDL